MNFNIDFIGRIKIWFAISATVILIGMVGLGARGLNFGIDFKGGTSFEVKTSKEVTVAKMREELKRLGIDNAVVQPVSGNQMLVRTRDISADEQAKVKNDIAQHFGVKPSEINVQSVGPGWGREITNAAVQALVLALAGLLVYISFRFEFKMAVAAIGALVHDILITIGIYALVGREVNPNTIAALLTILGYSLYDTIVVFHRIKENGGTMAKETYSAMVNRSINQVLIRSINTTMTVILPVGAILFLGGETLKDFAFALFIGIASGAYSSIFVATPLLTLWKEREPQNQVLRRKYGAQENAEVLATVK
ncbi:MAG: protein translocase subunit SecF [Actinobacteria bacterium]|nr:protein translocase subunit SecF [Actinomycetota bacterium]